MDKTEQFFKMANCPEIQKQKDITEQNLYVIDDKIAKKYRIPANGGGYRYGVLQWMGYIVGTGKSIYIFLGNYPPLRDISKTTWKKFTWLPRQDDIQVMMPKNKCKCPCCLTIHLYKFLEKNIEGLFDGNVDSMEQLWLAFYMHEKHSKIWSSEEEEWVKK